MSIKILDREQFSVERKGFIMTKEKLVKVIRGLLKTDNDLRFLVELKKEELEELIACIRYRLDGQLD